MSAYIFALSVGTFYGILKMLVPRVFILILTFQFQYIRKFLYTSHLYSILTKLHKMSNNSVYLINYDAGVTVNLKDVSIRHFQKESFVSSCIAQFKHIIGTQFISLSKAACYISSSCFIGEPFARRWLCARLIDGSICSRYCHWKRSLFLPYSQNALCMKLHVNVIAVRLLYIRGATILMQLCSRCCF